MNNNFFDIQRKDNLGLNSVIKKDKKLREEAKIYKDVDAFLYDKSQTCPICSNSFTSRTVKSHTARIKSKDSDSFFRYEGINPYFYDIIVCPYCGYSALLNEFPKLKSYQRAIIQEKVGSQWVKREFGRIYDEKIAIQRYKLALANAVLGEFKNSTKAVLCLKIAWMYRLLENKIDERVYLQKALDGFLMAYNDEDTPIYGLEIFELEYLIGELFRRVGDYTNAHKWLEKILLERADQKLKEKARDMLDLIKIENNNLI